MKNWEYTTLHYYNRTTGNLDNFRNEWVWNDDPSIPMNVRQRLNIMGQQGWELVGMYTLNGIAGAAWAGYTTSVIYVFKRPLP